MLFIELLLFIMVFTSFLQSFPTGHQIPSCRFVKIILPPLNWVGLDLLVLFYPREKNKKKCIFAD